MQARREQARIAGQQRTDLRQHQQQRRRGLLLHLLARHRHVHLQLRQQVRVDRVIIQGHLARLARLVQRTEQHVFQLAAEVKRLHFHLLPKQAADDLAPQRAAHFGRQQDRILGGFRTVEQGGGDGHDILQ